MGKRLDHEGKYVGKHAAGEYKRPTGAEIRAKYLAFEKEITEDLDGLYGTSLGEMRAVLDSPEKYSDEEIFRIFYGRPFEA